MIFLLCRGGDGVLPNNYPQSDLESLFGSTRNVITKAWFTNSDNQIVISNTQQLKLTAELGLWFCAARNSISLRRIQAGIQLVYISMFTFSIGQLLLNKLMRQTVLWLPISQSFLFDHQLMSAQIFSIRHSKVHPHPCEIQGAKPDPQGCLLSTPHAGIWLWLVSIRGQVP